jgi:amidase
VRSESMTDAFAAGLAVINAETWQAFGHLVESGKLGPDIESRLRAAAKTTATDLDAAERVRRSFTDEVDRALEQADVLVLPTMPALPITIEAARAGTSVIGMSSLIRPFNLSGHPALSIPVPLRQSLLKAGLQIVGRKGADEMVCAVAAHIEAALAG